MADIEKTLSKDTPVKGTIAVADTWYITIAGDNRGITGMLAPGATGNIEAAVAMSRDGDFVVNPDPAVTKATLAEWPAALGCIRLTAGTVAGKFHLACKPS